MAKCFGGQAMGRDEVRKARSQCATRLSTRETGQTVMQMTGSMAVWLFGCLAVLAYLIGHKTNRDPTFLRTSST